MIYFIACPDANAVKIGFARDTYMVFRRLENIASNCPLTVGLLGVDERGTRDDEKALLQRFRHIRTHGEWFLATRELLAYARQFPTPSKPWADRPRKAA